MHRDLRFQRIGAVLLPHHRQSHLDHHHFHHCDYLKLARLLGGEECDWSIAGRAEVVERNRSERQGAMEIRKPQRGKTA